MARWHCKYGTSFCGSFGELCDKCMADLETERQVKLARAGAPQAQTTSLDLTALNSEELRTLRRHIDSILSTRGTGGSVTATVELRIPGGFVVKF